MPEQHALPSTPAARITFWSGLLSLVFALWAQTRMWQVEFGLRPVAAGGGETMVGLFLGGPALLIALFLLGLSASRRPGASWAARAAFAVALVPALGLAWLFVRG